MYIRVIFQKIEIREFSDINKKGTIMNFNKTEQAEKL